MPEANLAQPGDGFASALSEAVVQTQEVRAAAPVGERIIYRASGGRRFAFSMIFLLLLPFFISLGPMLWSRIRTNAS